VGYFSLLSPLDGQDVGAKSKNMKNILYVFKNRLEYISNHPIQQGESILKDLINPSNHKFTDLLL